MSLTVFIPVPDSDGRCNQHNCQFVVGELFVGDERIKSIKSLPDS